MACATTGADIDTFLEILKNGCYPNFANAKKRSLLSYAVECGNMEIVKHLLR